MSRKLFEALLGLLALLAGAAGAWYGREPGVLRPRLPWTNLYLGNGTETDRERQMS